MDETHISLLFCRFFGNLTTTYWLLLVSPFSSIVMFLQRAVHVGLTVHPHPFYTRSSINSSPCPCAMFLMFLEDSPQMTVCLSVTLQIACTYSLSSLQLMGAKNTEWKFFFSSLSLSFLIFSSPAEPVIALRCNLVRGGKLMLRGDEMEKWKWGG